VSSAALPGIAVAIAATLAACGPTPPDATGCRAALLPGDLVITEVFADFQASGQAGGGDTGKEWFEIYNARDEAIDLSGLTITASRGDGSRPRAHTIRQARIAPGQYFTLGSAAPGATPAYVDYGYGADLGDLANTDGGTLALACGGAEIDRASYAGVRAGHARELTDHAVAYLNVDSSVAGPDFKASAVPSLNRLITQSARDVLGLNRILAITSPDNEGSAKLLGKIGLRFERMIKLSEDTDEVKLFTTLEGQTDERPSNSM